jgi:hypothetical protein
MMYNAKYTNHFYSGPKGDELKQRWKARVPSVSEPVPWI